MLAGSFYVLLFWLILVRVVVVVLLVVLVVTLCVGVVALLHGVTSVRLFVIGSCRRLLVLLGSLR